MTIALEAVNVFPSNLRLSNHFLAQSINTYFKKFKLHYHCKRIESFRVFETGVSGEKL